MRHHTIEQELDTMPVLLLYVLAAMALAIPTAMLSLAESQNAHRHVKTLWVGWAALWAALLWRAL